MEVPRYWRQKQYRGIEEQICPHCERVNLGQRPVCLNCGDDIGSRIIIVNPGNIFYKTANDSTSVHHAEINNDAQ